MPAPSPEEQTYPLFQATGSPRKLGRMHGEQAAPRICGYLACLEQTLRLSRTSMRSRALRFQPLFEQYAPHLMDEIRGLAEGAQIEYADALALQLRGELAGISEEACTTFAVGPMGTADRSILIGQTSDTPAELEQFAYVLNLRPDDRPEMLIWTFGGMLGYHGINEHGLGHFANALGGGPQWKFALSHYPLKRLFLECSDLEGVLRICREVPVCSSGNYMLCDRTGILDVELTSHGPFVHEDRGAAFLAHSNHFLCAPHSCRENFEQSLPDSFPRLDRIRELISGKIGQLTVADLQQILSDHSGHPVGICRHPHTGVGDAILPPTGKTIAAIIAEPARGRLHIARGNPCERPFATYSMAGKDKSRNSNV